MSGCNCDRCVVYNQKVINGRKHNFNKLGAILDKANKHEIKQQKKHKS